MSKKSATETRNELIEKINRLAIDTYGWAIEQKCCRDKTATDNPIQGFFTVSRSISKKSAKPHWPDAFDEDSSIWPAVYLRMLQLGFPICLDQFQGHYIGEDGEQGNKVATEFNHLYTRIGTAKDMLLAVLESRQWGLVEPHFQKRLKGDLQEVNIQQLCNVLDQVYVGLNIPVQMSMIEYLLTTNTED